MPAKEKSKRRSKHPFTLIELLVVIAIIAISDFGHAGKVVVDVTGLKFANSAVIDVETGKPVVIENGKITLDIPKHDSRLLKIAEGK